MSFSTVVRSGIIAAVALAMLGSDVFAQRGRRGDGDRGGGRSIGRSFRGGGDSGRSFRGGDSGRSSGRSFRGGDSGRSFGRSLRRGDSGRSFGRSFRRGDSGRSLGRSRSSRPEVRGYRGLQGDSGRRGISRSDQGQLRSRQGEGRSRIDSRRRLLGEDRPDFRRGESNRRETFRPDTEGRFLGRDRDSDRDRDFRRDRDRDFRRDRDDGRRRDWSNFDFSDRRWRERSRNWDRRDWDDWFRHGGFARHRDWDFGHRHRHHRHWHHGHWHHHDHLAWYLWPYFWSTGYGFGYWPYYNPYYSSDVFLGGPIYDYSQPLVVQPDDSLSDVEAQALARFDGARAIFRDGDYERALAEVDAVLRVLPNDPVLHEFRALVLFALGRYEESAATIYAVLAAGPGWDWATLAGLYPSVSVYTEQLRALEAYVRDNPDSAQARFLLGYHYMTAGHDEAAARQFRRVTELQPEDRVAPELLKALTGETPPAATARPQSAPPEGPPADDNAAAEPRSGAAQAAPELTAPPQTPASPEDQGEAADNAAPAFDPQAIVGSWTASRDDGSQFALTLTEDGRFTWQVQRDGRSENLEGTFASDGDRLILEPDQGGIMVARVSDLQDNQFHFTMEGGPQGDPGLIFQKQTE